MLYLLWLCQVKGVGPATANKLLKEFKDPRLVYQASLQELTKIEGLGRSRASLIQSSRSLDKAKKILEACEKHDIKILTCFDPLYPELAGSIPQAPPVLYYSGIMRPGNGGVSIIGARKSTAYGREVTCEAAEYLAENNIPVISGMAMGIDGYAHTACIKAGGYTLAFSGGGVDTCFPREHMSLKEAIIENGVVISPFPPGTQPRPGNFPRRNFLMASWSHKVLVVEAGQKSGALITADYARELNRQVLAVPGSIYNKESQGTNALLAKGAHPYLNPQQLLARDFISKNMENEEYSPPPPLPPSSPLPPSANPSAQPISKPSASSASKDLPSRRLDSSSSSNPLEAKICSLLRSSPLSMDQLAASFSQNMPEFLETLSLMELEGTVERIPGGKIILKKPGL